MDKQKQIEEMAKAVEPIIKDFYVTCTNGECDVCIVKRWTGKCHAETKSVRVAECYYNAGYRKIPENAVVLTKGEYEALVLEQKRLKEMVDRIPCGYELKEKTSKETAEKIFEDLYCWLDLEEIEKYGFVHIQKFDFLRKFRDIFKKIRNDEIMEKQNED